MTIPLILQILLVVCAMAAFCEYFIYFVVLSACSWPSVATADPTTQVHVMLLADTHLLGPRKGHWFDKLRREWQMHRAFQTAMTLHAPDVVFILGDVFDEGFWCTDDEFDRYVDRFHRLFRTPENVQLHVVAGNHDVGFHYRVEGRRYRKFVGAFDAPPVRTVAVGDVDFVLIDSTAMHGDGCSLCRSAERDVNRIGEQMRRSGRRPVLLQHFPLYRPSDAACEEPDSAPPEEAALSFRERWECLSKEATEMLLQVLQPRLVVTGHTHHGCHLVHPGDVHEWTLASFSWRNKNQPSYILASFTQNEHSLSKCYVPQESTVIMTYALGSVAAALWVVFRLRKRHLVRASKRD